MYAKKKIILWTGITVNTLAMMALTFYLMSLPWLAGDEKLLIWTTSYAKVLTRELPDSEKYALVNTSYDLTLIDRYDDFGFPVGNQVITDRNKLADFFEILAAAPVPPKYILCDIHFLESTADDDRLYQALKNIEHIILSAHLSENGTLQKPIFEAIDYGISDYVIGNIFEGVYKYQLFYEDSLKMTPLKMYEGLYEQNSQKKLAWVDLTAYQMPNNFVINYRLLQKDIYEQDAGFNPINLGELLLLPENAIQEYVADKMVVIGDFFENDMHETLYEVTSGPVILINAFLSLENQEVYLNPGFFVLLIIAYSYLGYMAFYDGDYLEMQIKKRFKKFKTFQLFAGFMSYLVILSITSILTFFIYGIHLNVFYLAVVFYFLDRLTAIIRRYKIRFT